MVTLDERAAVIRLFDRAGFGAGPDEIDAAARLGLAGTLDRPLAPAGADRGAAATPVRSIGALPARPRAGSDRRAYTGAVRAAGAAGRLVDRPDGAGRPGLARAAHAVLARAT